MRKGKKMSKKEVTDMNGLAVGKIVGYVMDQGPSAGDTRPAMIIRDWNTEDGLVNLLVFTDGYNDFPHEGKPVTLWETSVVYDPTGKLLDSWHFIDIPANPTPAQSVQSVQSAPTK
jgi:predicted metal-dependent peptidase